MVRVVSIPRSSLSLHESLAPSILRRVAILHNELFVESFVEHGCWNSPGFLPGMGVRNLYLDKFEFAGIVANSRVFRRDKQKYIHFITLGVGEGEYVDLIVDHPVKYSTGSVLVGQGERQSRDGSQFLQVPRKDIRAMAIDQYLNLV